MVELIIWIVVAVILFVLAKKSIDNNAPNISYNVKAVWITCLIIGLFWPLFIVIALIIWIFKRMKARKIIKEIDNKLSSVFK